MLSVPICIISGKCSFLPRISQISRIWLHVMHAHLWHQWEMFFSPTDFTDFHRFGYMLSVPICGISGNIFSPTDFHRFGYMLSVFICGISGKCSFLPRLFTDFHRFGYMLSVFICIISGKYLSSHGFHRFARIWLHVIRVHLCHQWGMFFFFTDFTDFHRFGYMLSVFICVISGKCSFLPRISLICTDLIINYPWVLCLWVK